MAKIKTQYSCSECGGVSPKWQGKCPHCGEWNTLTEETAVSSDNTAARFRSWTGQTAAVQDLSAVAAEETPRTPCGSSELDRVLGGGLVAGAMILLGGDPGIGKSTLLLQVCAHLAAAGKKVLYVSGEESLKQLKLRADRLGGEAGELSLLCETNLSVIEDTLLSCRPEVAVIDSIQTMYMEEISSAPGSVSQIREGTGVFLRLAKDEGISVFLVGHVTKEGTVAGPRVLEHMVDTVLYFEGDRFASYRMLRAVKNRFGSTNEVGVFEMRETGLSEVKNPSEFMLDGRESGASGSVVACAMEGTRPILLEIQALVTPTSFGYPKRQATGTDYNRVNLLMAVLEKRVGLKTAACDAYINLAGGLRVEEPALDLGIVLAVASSFLNRPAGNGVVAFGEVGLSGEVRAVSQAKERVLEAKKLGFTTVLLPRVCLKSVGHIEGIELVGVSSVGDAIRTIGKA